MIIGWLRRKGHKALKIKSTRKGVQNLDTALYNGDFLLDNRNRMVEISGIDEFLQKVSIILSVRKGSFCYDRNFGSELYKLRNYEDHLEDRAKMLAEEALYDLDYVKVNSVEVEIDSENDEITLTLHLIIDGENYDLEVKV